MTIGSLITQGKKGDGGFHDILTYSDRRRGLKYAFRNYLISPLEKRLG